MPERLYGSTHFKQSGRSWLEMALERMAYLRALADYLGKEVYALDFDDASGLFRLLPPPGAGFRPLALFRVITAAEDKTLDANSSSRAAPICWTYAATEYHIYREAMES
jgi:hypothetical protein